MMPQRLAAARRADEIELHRSRRVVVLLAVVIVLSLADLTLTLEYLCSTGMMEANPIAAFIIEHTGSATALVLYKLVTLAVCVALLFSARRHSAGELAAWCAVAILVTLTLHWHHYSLHFSDSENVVLAAGSSPDWLTLD